MITLQNELLKVAIAEHGAELISIHNYHKEYLWNGDSTYWGRHAPILFPIVGKVSNNEYQVDGATFHLGQHGFARDMDFMLVGNTSTEATLVLRHTAETLRCYPFPFELMAHYRLKEGRLEIEWTVSNIGSSLMYYQIGAHPAFLYKDFEKADSCHGYLQLFHQGQTLHHVRIAHLDTLGTVEEVSLPEGVLPLTDALFSADALILEESQADSALLLDKSRLPYLRLSFADAPVLGVWSPKGKQAPFVCIEPWQGRADAHDFAGDISQREWIRQLAVGQQASFGYEIALL